MPAWTDGHTPSPGTASGHAPRRCCRSGSPKEAGGRDMWGLHGGPAVTQGGSARAWGRTHPGTVCGCQPAEGRGVRGRGGDSPPSRGPHELDAPRGGRGGGPATAMGSCGLSATGRRAGCPCGQHQPGLGPPTDPVDPGQRAGSRPGVPRWCRSGTRRGDPSCWESPPAWRPHRERSLVSRRFRSQQGLRALGGHQLLGTAWGWKARRRPAWPHVHAQCPRTDRHGARQTRGHATGGYGCSGEHRPGRGWGEGPGSGWRWPPATGQGR